jgi:hypothetical protein
MSVIWREWKRVLQGSGTAFSLQLLDLTIFCRNIHFEKFTDCGLLLVVQNCAQISTFRRDMLFPFSGLKRVGWLYTKVYKEMAMRPGERG